MSTNKTTTSSASSGVASSASSNDASGNNRNSYSSQSSSATDYSSIYISLSFGTIIVVILFVACMFIRRQRAIMRGANVVTGTMHSSRNASRNPDFSVNESAQDDTDSVYNGPSYSSIVAELHRTIFATDNSTGHGNLHHHRHYAVGDEPPSGAKHHADLPPSYDNVVTLTTPARSVSVALSEPNSCTTSTSTESTVGHVDALLSPARSTADGLSNLAFRLDEPELRCSCTVPGAQAAAGVAVSSTQRTFDEQESTNVNLGDELPPPTYDQVINSVQ